MPPKNSSGKEKDLGEEDEVLQAVILADSFNKRFKPLTSGKPRCLLSVCNATLLDWTFESLALAGVQEIFVVCRSYPELVKAAIRDSKWSKPSLGLKIVPIITSKETFTPGDAMRDIYTRGIITSDFVLVMGDLVSNIRIDEVVRVHKERRRTNKDAIMTMVVKPSGVTHRTRSKGESAVFVLDAETSECLHYEHVTGYPPKKTARIPREIFAEHPEVEIRNDLMDCGIDVCSVEVPSLFQDNFDYGDIRRDFVHGVLTSDLLMKQIHCYVAREGYAARVADTRSYDSVSKDILARWTFPLVPDDNHPGGHSYEHLRGNKYIAKGNSVVLSRTCKISSNTLIGANTSIADNANIQASVIGQRCTIAANVTLRNAYIFDDTHIGAGSVIDHSIIGSNVKVGEGSTIARGCLVGDGVVLGKQARLGEFDRVSRRKGEDEEDDEEDEDEQNEESEDSELEEADETRQGPITAILGEGSNAIVWPKGPRSDDEDLDEVERFNNLRLMRIGDPATDLPLHNEGTDSDEDSDTESDSDSDDDLHALSRISSTTSASGTDIVSSSAIHSLQAAAAYHEFQAEVTQSLDRAFAEGHSVDNASVELKTLRMASNVPLRGVREAVVAAIVERIEVVEGDPGKQRVAIGKMVQRWGPLIDRIGGVDAVETVEVLQYHCAKSPRLPLFGQILAALYQMDIVEEDDIRAWYASPEAKGQGIKDETLAENIKRCWMTGAHMIKQFDEQDSGDEDSGEAESEDEDEEDTATVKAVPAAGKEESSEEEESEEESGSGEEESEEDESEDDAPAPKVPSSTQSAQPSASSAPKSAPPLPKEESESESEDDGDDESDEDSEDESAAPVVSNPSSQPAPLTSAPKTEESSEEEEGDDEDEEEESEEEEIPSSTQAKSTPTAAAAAPSAPAPVAQVAPPSSVPATIEESSEEEEDSSESDDDEPSQTVQKSTSLVADPTPTNASFSTVPAPPQAAKEESSESEESESEDDAASHVTAATAPVLLNVKSSSSETVRPPSTTASTTDANPASTSSIASSEPEPEPPVTPRPRPAFDGGSREGIVGSVGAGKQIVVEPALSSQVASVGAVISSRSTVSTSDNANDETRTAGPRTVGLPETQHTLRRQGEDDVRRTDKADVEDSEESGDDGGETDEEGDTEYSEEE